MSWLELRQILRDTVPDHCARIEAEVLRLLGGCRLSIPRPDRPRLDATDIQRALRANGWSVDAAARALGVHPVTIYRHLSAKATPPPAAPGGRLVR